MEIAYLNPILLVLNGIVSLRQLKCVPTTQFLKKKKLRIRKLAMQNPLLSIFAFLVQIEENTLRFTSIN